MPSKSQKMIASKVAKTGPPPSLLDTPIDASQRGSMVKEQSISSNVFMEQVFDRQDSGFSNSNPLKNTNTVAEDKKKLPGASKTINVSKELQLTRQGTSRQAYQKQESQTSNPLPVSSFFSDGLGPQKLLHVHQGVNLAAGEVLFQANTVEIKLPTNSSLGLVVDNDYEGVQVESVGGNARRRGMQAGDIITRINGVEIPPGFRAPHFAALVQQLREEDLVSVLILNILRVRVLVAKFLAPGPTGERAPLGLTLVPDKDTLVISAVSGAAKGQGLEAGDMVLAVNKEPVPHGFLPVHFPALLQAIKGPVCLTVVRMGHRLKHHNNGSSSGSDFYVKSEQDKTWVLAAFAFIGACFM